MGSNKLTFDQIVAGEGTYMEGISTDLGQWKNLADAIICVDGETLSVQGSKTHYCSPRTNEGPYTALEVGFPSVSPPYTWAEYFEGNFPRPHGLLYKRFNKLLNSIPGVSIPSPEEDDPTSSVYCYVPVFVVRNFIKAHGGDCLLYTSPSPRDRQRSRMPSSA